MDIATWNVNSVKARLATVERYLDEAKPDIIAFQEIKTVDEAFPAESFESRGYTLAVHGQKSYNGVAILSKHPIDEVQVGLPGMEGDEQARYIEAVVSLPKGAVRVASIYLPNGNPVGEAGDSEKYRYKLDWYAALRAHARELLSLEEAVVLAGDYNTIPRDEDTHDPAAWWGDALFRTETLDQWRALLASGYYSAFEMLSGAPGQYTFWDYQAGAWPRNHGIRIDHLVCSPQAMDRCEALRIDKHVRDWTKPSDHVPVVGRFSL